MYEYNICNQPDGEIFEKQCTVLEKCLPGIVKEPELRDVDDSIIQHYLFNESRVSVHLDNYVGAVYIKSDEELTKFFKD